MSSEVMLPTAEPLKQNAKVLNVRGEFNGSSTALLLIHFRARLDAVRPPEGHPESRPLIDRPLEERRGRTDVLFAQRHTERIAQMANHLMSGHASPTPLAVGDVPCPSDPALLSGRDHSGGFSSLGRAFYIQLAITRTVAPVVEIRALWALH